MGGRLDRTNGGYAASASTPLPNPSNASRFGWWTALPREADAAPNCHECGGTPDACICEALDRVLAEAPDPPETTHGHDHLGWLMGAIRESNRGVEL